MINGHDHDYERFAPPDPDRGADPARGIQDFVVGTGGPDQRLRHHPAQQRGPRHPIGVLRLTLKAASYDFRFVPIAGQTFTDAGSGTCH